MIFGLKKKIIQLLEKLVSENFLFFLKFFLFKSRFSQKRKKLGSNCVSIINTFQTTGGAAKVASNLFEGLSIDFNIRYFVKIKQSFVQGVVEIPQVEYSFLPELLKREAIKKGWIELTGFHSINLMEDSFFQQSGLVHLHNLHGEFFSPGLFSSVLNNKKVIWTLHDERILTGHCSCTLGCERWKLGCGNCPDLTIYPPIKEDKTFEVLEATKKWVTALNPVIVCPSTWLSNRVKYAYPSLKDVFVIPNGIDTAVFRPMDKHIVRKELNLPLDKKIVLFVAEFSTKNPFKGGSILRTLIQDEAFEQVIFVTVGGDTSSKQLNHISFPYIEDENIVAKLYASSDVLLYPTQADNLPLVVLESLGCGTPVIASNLGGIPEIIDDPNTGFLVDEFKESSAFKAVLHRFLAKNEAEINSMRDQCVHLIVRDFSKKQMLKKYSELYLKIMK